MSKNSISKVVTKKLSEMVPKSTLANEAILYKCEPTYWLFMPKWLRFIFGWITVLLFGFSFLTIPMCGIFLIPYVWRVAPVTAAIGVASVIASMLMPLKEWPWVRKVGQLWYEIFQFSANKSPEELMESVEYGDDHQLVMCMHPHGIVPYHAGLWAAYADQYMSDPTTGRALYGFGAAADAVGYVPGLRNIMGWLSAGSASYKVLKAGITKGISQACNAAGRKPRHLYILPGGVAEIFTSTPGRHTIVFKKRRGLVRLSIETGAQLVPCYVFGGTDFFHNLATDAGFFARLSRMCRAGVTIFWGRFGLPIPFCPRVTCVLGDPIVPPVWVKTSETERVPEILIDEMHAEFLVQMKALFEKYKASAGYPDAELEVM
eukprot:gene12233-14166_t